MMGILLIIGPPLIIIQWSPNQLGTVQAAKQVQIFKKLIVIFNLLIDLYLFVKFIFNSQDFEP